MLGFLFALVGGGSFVVTGVRVLFDSSCDTVSFSGGSHVITTTCYEAGAYASGDFPGWLGGLGSIALGLVIIFLGFIFSVRR